MSHKEYWETFWSEYQDEYPVENMNPGKQYTATCHDFRKGLKQQIKFIRLEQLDREQNILYMTNMQRLLSQIVTVAKRMNREDPDHAAVISRGVDHWDREFERLCDDRIMYYLQQAFLILCKDSEVRPSDRVGVRVVEILQHVLAVADVLLSDQELPDDFAYVSYGFPPDHERLFEVLPPDFDLPDVGETEAD